LNQYEKAIHLQNKPLIPPWIIESDKSLSAYLEENVKQNRQDEKIRLRAAKAKNTWANKRLEAAARQIKIEPVGPEPGAQKLSKPYNSEPPKQEYKPFNQAREEIQQSRKSWKCKKGATLPHFCGKGIEEEPREGTLVTETIKGIIVVCDSCGHRWTHHSANLGRQYYTQCGICRRNVRLKHYQVG
jgi:hypothetical protein